jgi:hypothetical protein
VDVLLERSAELIVSILAVLKASRSIERSASSNDRRASTIGFGSPASAARLIVRR